MANLRHKARLTLFGGERSWRLTDEGLVATAGKSRKCIPYADISGMRLITYAGAGSVQGRAILTTNGHGKHKIGSHHYVSLGNFEDRSSGYGRLIRELARRVEAANPKARFISGSLGLWIAWLVVCLLFAGLAALIVAVAMEGTSPTLRLIGGIVLVVAIGPFAVRWAVRSLPKRFDAKAIPERLLV